MAKKQVAPKETKPPVQVNTEVNVTADGDKQVANTDLKLRLVTNQGVVENATMADVIKELENATVKGVAVLVEDRLPEGSVVVAKSISHTTIRIPNK